MSGAPARAKFTGSESSAMTRKGKRPNPQDSAEVLDRYPSLVGHMVCESLGYFTPRAAAGALLDYIHEKETWCEWYLDMRDRGTRDLLEIGRKVVARSFSRRHSHRGYMAEYKIAKVLVDRERSGKEAPILASWF